MNSEKIIRLKNGFSDSVVSEFQHEITQIPRSSPEEKAALKQEIASRNHVCTMMANYSFIDANIVPVITDMFNECQGFYIAGGAARSIARGRGRPNDYDIFFVDEFSANRMLEFLHAEGFIATFVCPKGHLTNMEKDQCKIQLITPRFYPTVFDLIDSFDFTATQFAIRSSAPLMVYSRLLSVGDVLSERLRINVLEYPLATLKRVRKYMSYGFSPSNDLFDEICAAIDELFRRAEEEPGTIEDIRSMSRLYID